MVGAASTGAAGSVREENWYRTVWRWHFYAGLFTVPFILWLSVTGGIYLFKPQIEAWLDRPYAGLADPAAALPPSALAARALAAVPGSILHRYVLPESPGDARQIVVGKGAEETRVYLQPASGEVLKTVGEQDRFMRVMFYLHGELMAGRWGSTLVELAASWAIIMLLTGLFLWWPRGAKRLGGVLYPRLRLGRRAFWRDIHAVTGIWVSLMALFLISSGLPWAKNWGTYLRDVREWTGTTSQSQDWFVSSPEEAMQRAKLDAGARSALTGHEGHSGMEGMAMPTPAIASLKPLDRVVPTAASLDLLGPVEISPPTGQGTLWQVISNTPNRPQRVTLQIEGMNGEVTSREDFADRHWIDRTVGYGIAAHEGALFGPANQLLSLATVIGLVMLALSSIAMWWKRRPHGMIGVPPPQGRLRHSWLLVALTVLLGFLVPLFGLSLGAVVLTEILWLRRNRKIATQLGLRVVARR